MSNRTGRAIPSQSESSLEDVTLELSLQALGPALLLLDRTGRVICVSRKAQALLGSGDSLRLKDGYLSTPDPSQSVALTALIAATLDPQMNRRSPQVPPVLIARQAGGVYRVSALEIASSTCQAFGGRLRRMGAIVFIRAIHANTDALARVLHLLYGLTHAEIRLALLLHEGRTLSDCARNNGVSIETVRAQLKSIFQKAGLHRQSRLLDLLNELAKPG